MCRDAWCQSKRQQFSGIGSAFICSFCPCRGGLKTPKTGDWFSTFSECGQFNRNRVGEVVNNCETVEGKKGIYTDDSIDMDALVLPCFGAELGVGITLWFTASLDIPPAPTVGDR